MTLILGNYNPVKLNNNDLYYYFDKVDGDELEGETYDQIDKQIENDVTDNTQKENINNQRKSLIQNLTRKRLNLLEDINQGEDKKVYTDKKYKFRFVDVNNDDYKSFLLEKKLYELLKDNVHINIHYFRSKIQNKFLYNITNTINYNNILTEIDNENTIDENNYVVLNEVQFVNNNNNINGLLNVGNSEKKIAKCYLFEKIENKTEEEKKIEKEKNKTEEEKKIEKEKNKTEEEKKIEKEKNKTEEEKKEEVKNYITEKFNFFGFNTFLSDINKILDVDIIFNNDIQKEFIDQIMKKYKNGKIENFIGIYKFINSYTPPKTVQDIQLDNIAYLIAAEKQLNPDKPPLINAQTGGSSFPRIASLLAASQINMPPLLSPISSFYEKYIKYKSKYLKLQKIKSLKY